MNERIFSGSWQNPVLTQFPGIPSHQEEDRMFYYRGEVITATAPLYETPREITLEIKPMFGCPDSVFCETQHQEPGEQARFVIPGPRTQRWKEGTYSFYLAATDLSKDPSNKIIIYNGHLDMKTPG